MLIRMPTTVKLCMPTGCEKGILPIYKELLSVMI